MPRSSSSSDDEAPESVSLSTSKSSFLTHLKSSNTAASALAKEARSRRRDRDALLKEQAATRATRVAAIVQELASCPKEKKGTDVQPTKRIFKSEEGEEEEEEHGPVVMINSKRVAKFNVEAASKLKQSREELLMIRNKRTRVHASVSQAPKRIGLPATKFSLRPEEHTRVFKHNKNSRKSKKQ